VPSTRRCASQTQHDLVVVQLSHAATPFARTRRFLLRAGCEIGAGCATSKIDRQIAQRPRDSHRCARLHEFDTFSLFWPSSERRLVEAKFGHRFHHKPTLCCAARP
jgi:hypothetical protein